MKKEIKTVQDIMELYDNIDWEYMDTSSLPVGTSELAQRRLRELDGYPVWIVADDGSALVGELGDRIIDVNNNILYHYENGRWVKIRSNS